VQRQLHRLAAVATLDHLVVPVETVLDTLALAQTAALEAIGLRQEGVAFGSEGAALVEAGDQHGGVEGQPPAAIVQLLEAALGGAADRYLFPVGGVAGGEGLELQGLDRKGQHGESKQQGATHGIS